MEPPRPRSGSRARRLRRPAREGDRGWRDPLGGEAKRRFPILPAEAPGRFSAPGAGALDLKRIILLFFIFSLLLLFFFGGGTEAGFFPVRAARGG